MSRVYRWRRCPSCRAVRPAGQFTMLTYRKTSWNDTAKRGRRCPNCGHTGPGFTFKVVAGEHRVSGG
jgi:hypothetical protein